MLELHLRTYGSPDRPCVLLLHGLFGSSSNWGAVARQLEPHYRVLVPDLRNHGQSPHHDDCGYPAMVDDVLRLLDAHDIGAATLVGHSMGGKVAMHLALNHPQRVSRLAVVDMSPVRYTHNFNAVLGGFGAVDLDTIRSRADADRQMSPSINGGGVRAFLLQNLVKDAEGWRWRLNLPALAAAQAQITGFPDQRSDATFDGGAHFIHGVLSDYVTPAHGPAIRRFFPHAKLCPVDGAGHWVYADQPQGFMGCLQAMLIASEAGH